MPNEDSIRHKYTPLPEDSPRHRKKAKKKHVRSDHKHEYEDVAVDAHTTMYTRKTGRVRTLFIAQRCNVCGKVYDWTHTKLQDPPEGMKLYEVADIEALFDTKFLTDEMRVGRQ